MEARGSLRFFLILMVSVVIGPSEAQVTDNEDKLKVAYQWKQVDYNWPVNEEIKKFLPDYKQEDNLPLGLEITPDRIFVTVPRWKRGVAATLSYINRNDTRQSPPLNPYPSWDSHKYTPGGGIPEIVSVFRIRADNCNRLWVLDTGVVDILGTPEQQAPPALLVYDLTNDHLLRKFVIPKSQKTGDSLFANIAVEDQSCDDTYAYLGDLGGPGIVVYSWRFDKSWLVKHHFFQPDPQGGEFNVSGVSFQWTDGVFGMSLAPTRDGYSILYFHPLSSSMEYAVSTKHLRDQEKAVSTDNVHEFRVVGNRGTTRQSSVSFFDTKTGVLFYALVNFNAIGCWRTDLPYDNDKRGIVYANNVTMIFPNDMKVDRESNIWILSDRLPYFMYLHLDPTDFNFRILTGATKDLVRGTVCDNKSDRTEKQLYPSFETPNTIDVQSRTKVGSSANAIQLTSTLSILLSVMLSNFI